MLRTHVWLSSWLGLAVLAAPAHAAPPLTWQAIGPVRATPMLSGFPAGDVSARSNARGDLLLRVRLSDRHPRGPVTLILGPQSGWGPSSPTLARKIQLRSRADLSGVSGTVRVRAATLQRRFGSQPLALFGRYAQLTNGTPSGPVIELHPSGPHAHFENYLVP